MANEKLRTSFGKISDLYDDARPDYPPELIRDVIEISGIPRNGKILEIGTGTGKATLSFAERDYCITALDISEQQIAIARNNLANFSNIKYVVSSFEEAELPSGNFDLVFAAQTFHWVDPKVGYVKVHHCLKDGGYLALFSNFQKKDAELEANVRKLYAKHCPAFIGDEYGTLKLLQKQFEESRLFADIDKRVYLRSIPYSREKYVRLINSLSWVSTLPQKKKKIFFSELADLLKGEAFTIPTESILLIAKKK